MEWSTPDGVCAVGQHEITDAPAVENKGYMSPAAIQWEPYTSGAGQTQSSRAKPADRLCREHYLEAFAVRYPEEPLPVI